MIGTNQHSLARRRIAGLFLGYFASVAIFFLMAPSAITHPQTQLRFPHFQYLWPLVLFVVGLPATGLIFTKFQSRSFLFWIALVVLGVALPLVAILLGYTFTGAIRELLPFPIVALAEILGTLILISWAKFNSLLSFSILILGPLLAERTKRGGNP